ncbi:hypothetical protein D555_2856 [Bordetella holmesii 35009]|nr:hypothetical protein D555_2856 [Bordetella holmesii 35009]
MPPAPWLKLWPSLSSGRPTARPTPKAPSRMARNGAILRALISTTMASRATTQ